MAGGFAMTLNLIERAIADIKAGKMVVVVDDEDRENEGDLVCAAELVTPETINFMTMHGRGWICLALTPEDCERLELPQMVERNSESMSTAFTVTIDAQRRFGVTTGISASDKIGSPIFTVTRSTFPPRASSARESTPRPVSTFIGLALLSP